MKVFEVTLDAPIPAVEPEVDAALAAEGFGVLARIDVAATLAAKLGVDRPGLKILEVCSPPFAHQALEFDPSVALLLPCKIVLEELDDQRTRVVIADPREVLAAGDRGDDPRLRSLAGEVAEALERARDRLAR